MSCFFQGLGFRVGWYMSCFFQGTQDETEGGGGKGGGFLEGKPQESETFL
jgi:hypothetical protein